MIFGNALLKDTRRPRVWVRSLAAAVLVIGAVSLSVADALIAPGSAMTLNGPWQFQIGDDPQWANPDFDDKMWESVDLTPLPGAHDGDQGLTRYTGGWSERGHRGYDGFAWYRM